MISSSFWFLFVFWCLVIFGQELELFGGNFRIRPLLIFLVVLFLLLRLVYDGMSAIEKRDGEKPLPSVASQTLTGQTRSLATIFALSHIVLPSMSSMSAHSRSTTKNFSTHVLVAYPALWKITPKSMHPVGLRAASSIIGDETDGSRSCMSSSSPSHLTLALVTRLYPSRGASVAFTSTKNLFFFS